MFRRHPHFDPSINATHPAFKELNLGAMAHYFARTPDIDITGWLPRISAPLLVETRLDM
mgnify:CR=1 FL=1